VQPARAWIAPREEEGLAAGDDADAVDDLLGAVPLGQETVRLRGSAKDATALVLQG
jgi:hypothetical protein